MPTYDYTCEAGHTTESRQGIQVETIPCPTCGLSARREAIYLNQFTFALSQSQGKGGRRAEVPLGDRRVKTALFQEACQEIDHAATKVEQETGQPVKTPNYYKMGVRKAKRIKAGLEAPLKV